MIIQVQISVCGQTEIVSVHSDSTGKTLYQMIQERSGILVPQQILIMMHGLKIIRHSLSLQEQGIGHLSTVFVLPAMVKGGARTRLGICMEI